MSYELVYSMCSYIEVHWNVTREHLTIKLVNESKAENERNFWWVWRDLLTCHAANDKTAHIKNSLCRFQWMICSSSKNTLIYTVVNWGFSVKIAQARRLLSYLKRRNAKETIIQRSINRNCVYKLHWCYPKRHFVTLT